MNIKGLGAAVILGLGLPATAMAQDANAALCHHAGLTYSPGSMMRMGESLQQCALADGIGSWSAVTISSDAETSANCISGGREFSQGTVLVAGASELVCRHGIWFKN